MNRLEIQDALNEADQNAYYSRWGYDGFGTPGPMESYETHMRKVREMPILRRRKGTVTMGERGYHRTLSQRKGR